MNVCGFKELQADVLQRDLCVGCGACVGLCPYLRSHNGKTVMLFPCTQSQGRCFAYCPRAEVDLEEVSMHLHGKGYDPASIGAVKGVHASKAGSKVPRSSFQAGGTVSALVMLALDQGLVDAAVLTDREGIVPRPRIVTNADEVGRCTTSKFAAAPVVAALNEAISKGLRRIGVVATPCQALAIAQMRMNPTKREDFVDPVAMVIGLFCTWALDQQRFVSLLKGKVDLETIVKCHIPPPPAEVFEIYTDNGTLAVPLGEVRPLVPNGCAYCTDMTSEFADVAVGMMEGASDMNTLIVRTDRGETLVRSAAEHEYVVLSELPGETLSHLREAALAKKARAFKRAVDEGMVNTQGEGKRSCYRVNAATLEHIVS